MKLKVSHEDFVVCWVTSDTMDDVIKGTGMTREACQERARTLRDRGVRLAKLPNVSHKEEQIKDLNRLVDKYSKINRRRF